MSLEKERIEERQSLAILAGEILRDTQKLFDQQVTLTKLQLAEDLNRAKPVAFWLAAGLIALCGATVLSALTLVYILQELTALQLWACFAITNVAFLLVTAVGLTIARAKLKGMSLLNG